MTLTPRAAHCAPLIALIVAISLLLLAPAVHAAPIHAKIIGGAKPSDQQYEASLRPLVALISMGSADQYDGQFCGGTLIAPTVVLTAAHCVVENDPYDYRTAPSAIGVLVGSRTLKTRTLDRASLVPVQTIYVNPNFNLNTFRYDIALLRLSRPVTDTPTMQILSDEESNALGIGANEVAALAAGWGDTNSASENCCFPTDLQSVNQTIHTSTKCTSNLEDSPTWRFNPEIQLCSGSMGHDTCQGDSGGPLVVTVADTPRVAGIVSHGVGCGDGYYGIYSRASTLRGWVASLPGTTEGDARDVAHGFDDSTAPTLVSTQALDYDRVRITVAAGSGGSPMRYTAYHRSGRADAAEDVFLGSFTSSSFIVSLQPTRSRVPYTVIVRGVTSTGETPGLAVRTMPRRDLVAPSRPRALAAHLSRGRLTVTWRASVDRQGGLHSYEVQVRSGRRWGVIRRVWAPKVRFSMRTSSHGMVRVRARDWAGNAGSWTTPKAY